MVVDDPPTPRFEIIAPVELPEVLTLTVIIVLMRLILNPLKVGGDRQ